MSSISGIANTDNLSTQDTSQTPSKTNKISDTLNNLVSSGKITQDQETAIQSALTTAFQSNSTQSSSASSASSKTSPLASLVSNGTITQDQANTVDSALKSSHHHHHHGGGSSSDSSTLSTSSTSSNPLDSLVSNGTISKDQEDSITKTLEAEEAAHQNANDPSNLLPTSNGFSVSA